MKRITIPMRCCYSYGRGTLFSIHRKILYRGILYKKVSGMQIKLLKNNNINDIIKLKLSKNNN